MLQLPRVSTDVGYFIEGVKLPADVGQIITWKRFVRRQSSVCLKTGYSSRWDLSQDGVQFVPEREILFQDGIQFISKRGSLYQDERYSMSQEGVQFVPRRGTVCPKMGYSLSQDGIQFIPRRGTLCSKEYRLSQTVYPRRSTVRPNRRQLVLRGGKVGLLSKQSSNS